MNKKLIFLLTIILVFVCIEKSKANSPNAYLYKATMRLSGEAPSAPPVPSVTNNCGSSTLTEPAPPAGSGILYYWQETNPSGTNITKPASSAYTATTSGTYYVRAYNEFGWSPSTGIYVSVKAIPAQATSSNQSRCGSGTVTLTASCSTPGATFNWYQGSTLKLSGEATYSPNITATTTYTVISYLNGCIGTGSNVLATVKPIPSVTGATSAARCSTGTVTLGAVASAGTIKWYGESTGTESYLAGGTSYTTPSINETTTYYVDATDNGCTTASRTSVLATIFTKPTVSASNNGPICMGSTLAMTGEPGGMAHSRQAKGLQARIKRVFR
jgi:hypothetical protein